MCRPCRRSGAAAAFSYHGSRRGLLGIAPAGAGKSVFEPGKTRPGRNFISLRRNLKGTQIVVFGISPLLTAESFAPSLIFLDFHAETHRGSASNHGDANQEIGDFLGIFALTIRQPCHRRFFLSPLRLPATIPSRSTLCRKELSRFTTSQVAIFSPIPAIL